MPGASGAYDPAAYQAYGYGYSYPQQPAYQPYGYDVGQGGGGYAPSAVPKTAPPPPPADYPGPFQIFVGDLGREVVDSLLHGTFAQHGLPPKSCKILTDQATGRSKGFGFVVFETRAEAERALAELQQVLVGSRRIRLNWGSHHNQKWPGAGGHAAGGASPAPLPPSGPYGQPMGGPGAYGAQGATGFSNGGGAAQFAQQGYGGPQGFPGQQPPPGQGQAFGRRF